jgi:hypothetical protein
MEQSRSAPVGWRRSNHGLGIADRWHSIWEVSKPAFALLALPLAVFLIIQNWRFNSVIDAERAIVETQQARIRYLNDKLEALALLETEKISGPEIKSVATLRLANSDGTFTVTKIVDVVSKQLPKKLIIASRGEDILRMTVRPQRFENKVVYGGIAWYEPSKPSLLPQHYVEKLLPQHYVEVEYPLGRYAVEVTSKNDDVTLDYKFAR